MFVIDQKTYDLVLEKANIKDLKDKFNKALLEVDDLCFKLSRKQYESPYEYIEEHQKDLSNFIKAKEECIKINNAIQRLSPQIMVKESLWIYSAPIILNLN